MKPTTFRLDEFAFTIERLTDHQFYRLAQRSVAIQEDGFYLFQLRRDGLNMAELHYTLQRLFGRSGRAFDPWKSSFCFPFLVEIERGEEKFEYTLAVRNYRSSVEYLFRRIVNRPEEVDDVIHPPFDAELSRDDMNSMSAFLCGYFVGRFEVLQERRVRVRPFVRWVQSNLIAYGFRNGHFFEDHFKTESEFLIHDALNYTVREIR